MEVYHTHMEEQFTAIRLENSEQFAAMDQKNSKRFDNTMKAIEVLTRKKVEENPEKTYDDTGFEKPGGGAKGKVHWRLSG